MLNFTDNASEGTNRMSAIKLKQSKLSGANTVDHTPIMLQGANQVSFE